MTVSFFKIQCRRYFPRIVIFFVVITVVVGLLGFRVGRASANGSTVISVTTLFDEFSGDREGLGCSLREAIQAANTRAPFGGCPAGGDVVVINLPPGYYYLLRTGSNEDNNNSGDLDVYHRNLTIQGAHKDTTVIHGWGADRVFDVHPGSGVDIVGVTIMGGITPVGGYGRDGEEGGGIRNRGSLLLRESEVKGNITGGGGKGIGTQRGGNGGAGGGIYNSGTLILTVTTVRENLTGGGGHGGAKSPAGNGGNGGGIFNDKKGKIYIYNSTISYNQTGTGSDSGRGFTSGDGGDGAGIYNQGWGLIKTSTISGNVTGIGGWDDFNDGDGGGIYNHQGSLELSDVTIAVNIAIGRGGGIFNEKDATVQFRNTLIANNRSEMEKGRDCFGRLYSLDYNLIDVMDQCQVDGEDEHNIRDGEPNLSVLHNYGGLTETHELQRGSAAIDRIPVGVNGCGTTADQRGLSRPAGSYCDIGAYEVGAPLLLPGTGFAPGQMSFLPPQPTEKRYTAQNNLWLSIPSINQKLPIVAVPVVGEEWDLTWLDQEAGYLEGTAFPTFEGNSVITGHVYRSNGKPGPFVDLKNLKWGDSIYIDAWGERYRYEVRSVKVVAPDDMSILGHKKEPWITLLTCKGYDPDKDKYLWRLAVQAVLIKVESLAP